jgi:hypothetical protein
MERREEKMAHIFRKEFNIHSLESIIFRDVNGAVIKTIQPLPTAIYPSHQFIGLLSFTRPIAQVEIVEMDNNGDDISIDHVVLSN